MPQFFVIGLNALGRSLARELYARGNKVKLGDISQDRINRMCQEIPDVVRIDSTERDALSELHVDQFDHIIVCMGHRFEVAERTTLALKDLGAKKITNVATTEVRARILKEIGADEVITPGLELSRNLAVALTDTRIDKFTFVDGKLGIAEVSVPQAFTFPDAWRESLGESCVVTGVRRRPEENRDVEKKNLGGVSLEVGDRLIVYGAPEAISRSLDRVF